MQTSSLAGTVTAAFLLGSRARLLVRPLKERQHHADTVTAATLHRLAAVLNDFGAAMLHLEHNMPEALKGALAASPV